MIHKNHNRGFTPLEVLPEKFSKKNFSTNRQSKKETNNMYPLAAPKSNKDRLLTGFTLLEMLVYVAVISLVIAAVSAMLLWSVRSQAKTKVMSEVSRQGERAMAVMTREVRGALGVYTPTSVFGVHPGQLSLQTAASVPPGENVGYADFFLCGTRLCLKREAQNPIALTSESVVVENLVFSLVSATSSYSSVQIALSLRYNSSAQQPMYQASASFRSSAAVRSPR